MTYQEKYLKYKNKYINLSNLFFENMIGGLHEINPDRLLDSIPSKYIPKELKKLIELITIKDPDSSIIRVGSASMKIQPYPSDVDIMNIISKNIKTDEVVRFFIDMIKTIVRNILTNDNVLFSDFKAGDVHWTVDQILEGHNGTISLMEACKKRFVIKIDMFAPYDNRYVEMSTFFILKSESGYINIDPNYFIEFQKSLLEDINVYKNDKPLKAAKRYWSYAKTTKNFSLLNKLYKLINSNISLLSQINADIETIILMINKKVNYDINFVINAIEHFKEKIQRILDIEIDDQKVIVMINNIILLLQTENTEDLLNSLNELHDYLLEIINKETLAYLKKNKISFPEIKNPIKSYNKDENLQKILA
jgi:hypothetical protein